MDEYPYASMKRCTKCSQIFPATLEHFYSSKGAKSSKDGLYSRCKACVSGARRKRPKLPDGYKRCPRCTQILPQSAEYFYVVNSRPDGLAAYCKSCQHERQLDAYARAKNKVREKAEVLICGRCGVSKPATLEFFMMNPLCHYGLNTICRTCTNTRSILLHRLNPEKRLATWRKHYQRRGFLYYKHRYQEQREQILAKQHKFFAEHPDVVRAWKRRYAKTDRGHHIARVREQKRRARKLKAGGTYTLQDIEQQQRRQRNKCYYCKCQLRKYHIEHVVPLSRGGTNDIGNIVLSCPTCNLKKGNKLPHEWAQGGHLL